MTKQNKDEDRQQIPGLNGWWRLVVGILIGALAPSLVAWGSMGTKIDTNTTAIGTKVSKEAFDMYKTGEDKYQKIMCATLERMEDKMDNYILKTLNHTVED